MKFQGWLFVSGSSLKLTEVTICQNEYFIMLSLCHSFRMCKFSLFVSIFLEFIELLNFGMEFSDWTNTEKRFPNQSEMFFLPTRDASVAFGKWLSSSSKANSPIGFIKNMSSKGWLSIKDTWIPSNPSLLYSACKCTEIVTTTFSQLTFKSSTGQELNFWILLACRDGFYRPDSNSTSLGRSVCG